MHLGSTATTIYATLFSKCVDNLCCTLGNSQPMSTVGQPGWIFWGFVCLLVSFIAFVVDHLFACYDNFVCYT